MQARLHEKNRQKQPIQSRRSWRKIFKKIEFSLYVDGLLVNKNINFWNVFAYGNRSNFLKLYHCLSKRNTRNFLGKFVKADTNLLFLESFQKQTTYAENKTNKFRKKGFFQSKVTATNLEIGLAWETRLCEDVLMFLSIFCGKNPPA